MKINWVQKVTSRKMWVAIANFIGMMYVFFGYPQETATQITALIMAGAGALAYIVGEGLIDAKAVNTGIEEIEE